MGRVLTGNGTRVQAKSSVFARLSPTLKEGFDQTALTRHVWITPYLTPATLYRERAFWFLPQANLEEADGFRASHDRLLVLLEVPAARANPVDEQISGLPARLAQ